MKQKFFFTLIFLFLSFSAIQAKTNDYNIVLAKKPNPISQKFNNTSFIHFNDLLNNGLKKLYTLLLITGIVFTLLGLLISPILVIFGLVLVVFSIILLLKN